MEDRIRVYITLYLITINPINSLISHYLKLVGIRVGDLSLILYMGALAGVAYWILKNGLDVYDFGWLLAAYLFYGIQWLLCKADVRRYLTQGSILAIYRFYLPTVFFITKNVKNWRILYTDKLCIRYADMMTILALIMKLTSTKAVNRYTYMDF